MVYTCLYGLHEACVCLVYTCLYGLHLPVWFTPACIVYTCLYGLHLPVWFTPACMVYTCGSCRDLGHRSCAHSARHVAPELRGRGA
jgi:hypothetical protein